MRGSSHPREKLRPENRSEISQRVRQSDDESDPYVDQYPWAELEAHVERDVHEGHWQTFPEEEWLKMLADPEGELNILPDDPSRDLNERGILAEK